MLLGANFKSATTGLVHVRPGRMHVLVVGETEITVGPPCHSVGSAIALYRCRTARIPSRRAKLALHVAGAESARRSVPVAATPSLLGALATVTSNSLSDSAQLF